MVGYLIFWLLIISLLILTSIYNLKKYKKIQENNIPILWYEHVVNNFIIFSSVFINVYIVTTFSLGAENIFTINFPKLTLLAVILFSITIFFATLFYISCIDEKRLIEKKRKQEEEGKEETNYIS